MFDVSWGDPAAETVRQRKNRVGQQPSTSTSSSRPESAVSSASSEASTRKHRPSALTLFHRSSKKDLNRPESRPEPRSPRSVVNVYPAEDPVTNVSRAVPERSSPNKYAFPTRKLAAKMPTATATFYLDDMPPDLAELPSGEVKASYNSLDEQNFTRWATQSVISDSSWGSSTELARRSQLVQPLSPTSFHSCVTRGTEFTSADEVDPREHGRRTPASRGDVTPEEKGLPIKRPSSVSSFDMPLQDCKPAEKETLPKQVDAAEKPIVAVMMVSGPNSPTRPTPAVVVEGPADTIPPVPSLPAKHPARDADKAVGKHEGTVKLDLSYLQKSVRRMEAASVKIVLERLTEEWTEIPDATLYVELDMEKKLWMRTALHTSCQESSFRSDVNPQFGDDDPSKLETMQILSLYEDHASTTFLSALNSTADIHHLSPFPLLADSSTNLRPLFVPGLASSLPYSSSFFTSIHASLSLTALVPSASIPPLLAECARTLAPNRTLHLTLIDPSPIPSTAGPFLRSWLDCHLVIPLEHAAHCIHPTTLFPLWLADAGLNGSGSSMSSRRFAAAAETALIVSYHQGEGQKGAGEETRQELMRMVGMMLWEETWGGFIKGSRRWWNDREVMAECVRLGTMWEYFLVEAVKEG